MTDSNDHRLTLEELCEAAGVPVSAVRDYGERGLLALHGSGRCFTFAHVLGVKIVHQLETLRAPMPPHGNDAEAPTGEVEQELASPEPGTDPPVPRD